MNLNKTKNKSAYGNIPNSFLYFLVCRFSKTFLKLKYRLKIENGSIKDLKPPFIVLGNHPSSLDPFIMAVTMYPHKINFLGTNYYFRIPILRPFLRLGGVMPKVQAYKDTRAVRMMNKVIARGGIVGLCPEGRRSTDGSQYPISDSIAKLIKLYNVPVVAVVSRGAYLSMPRWSAFSRRGLIEVSAREVLTAEQVEKLSLEEIYRAVCGSIYYNEYKWNKDRKISFKHKRIAEDIHNVLHKCPSCGSDKAMVSKSNKLYCRFCGNAAIMNEYMLFKPEKKTSIIFEDAVKWLSWQRYKAKEQVQNSDFSLSSIVTKLQITDAFTEAFHNAGKGEILLNHNGLTFNGIVYSEQKEMFFPLTVIASVSSGFGSHFEITDGKNTYVFFLEYGQDVIRFELAIKEMVKLKNGSEF